MLEYKGATLVKKYMRFPRCVECYFNSYELICNAEKHNLEQCVDFVYKELIEY